MITKIKQLIMGLTLVASFSLFVFAVPTVGAASAVDEACKVDPNATICKSSTSVNDLVTTIVNILLFVIGAISVVMIIIGGIMYATSSGDSGQVTKAKNTLLYAVIGLVVAFAAFAIVNWVVARFI